MTQTPRETRRDPADDADKDDNGREQDRQAIRGEQGTSEGDPQNDADPVDPG